MLNLCVINENLGSFPYKKGGLNVPREHRYVALNHFVLIYFVDQPVPVRC